MSTFWSIFTLSLFLRFTFSVHHMHICNETHAPCHWNCDQNTQCINDIFTCNSSAGCILNCATSSSCSNATIHKYGIGIMNIICNKASSCNDMNITNHDGYIYVLCQSHDSCSNLNINCFPNSAHCYKSYTNTTILSIENDKKDIPLHELLISKLSFYQFLVLSSLILLSVVLNALICCWCLCCSKCTQTNKAIHRRTNNQCVESLKHSNNIEKNSYYDSEEDDQYTEALKKRSTESIDEYVMRETNEPYLVSLKPPHDYSDYNEYNSTAYIENGECDEHIEDIQDVEEHNDLQNAPCLELGDLDDSVDDNGVTMRGDDADITFWNELPSSPKKQELISDEKHDFKDSEEEDNESKASEELKEDMVPNITNNGALPIDKTQESDFELLNSKKNPFEHSIISPRNICDKSTQIGRFVVNENAGDDVINEQKEHNFVEHDEEQILTKLSSKMVENKKGNMSSRRSKQSSREMMSVANEVLKDMKLGHDESDIIKFSADENVNGLKPIKQNVADKSKRIMHKFSGNLKFINDEEQENEIETGLTVQKTMKHKENKMNFALLFSSPRSNSPSISPRNITAISPRKIIDSIIKKSISPKPRNHELLLCQNGDDDDVYKQHIDYDEHANSTEDIQLLNSMRNHDMV